MYLRISHATVWIYVAINSSTLLNHLPKAHLTAFTLKDIESLVVFHFSLHGEKVSSHPQRLLTESCVT